MQTLTKQTVSQVAAKKEEADVRAKIRTTLIYSTPDFATPKPLLEPMVCNYAGVLEKKKVLLAFSTTHLTALIRVGHIAPAHLSFADSPMFIASDAMFLLLLSLQFAPI